MCCWWEGGFGTIKSSFCACVCCFNMRRLATSPQRQRSRHFCASVVLAVRLARPFACDHPPSYGLVPWAYEAEVERAVSLLATFDIVPSFCLTGYNELGLYVGPVVG
jgi:hypothetical protein